ncbi:ABC transporter permease [Bifidobacterium longum subsp. infantis]|uniref:ABC transporter permease n=1 Tax=Bifidobacterium longum subsp. infantis TaxID=1682 RepID=A0AAX1LL30_BIFLI|nr:ABC transporter permease [Bifidobacterium longum]QSP97492.1 ABC transporter permease [Bifidobacterium longum subsp. infantis]QSZ17739.1 ABC transporter permease [Bifidobacterium longum subsp. infantis]QTB92783.1 ABC transporter permease [Bifidobacterium longum subsp. infantis]
MKHLYHRTIAIIVALLSTLSLALAVISLPHQAYAVDGADGTSGTNSTSQGSDGDSTPLAGPVPNIIITNFAYGGDSVAAGSKFNLDFTFQNKGQVAVTNMVVTVDGAEGFAIAGGTNTFYVDALWAGYSMTQTVPMQALASAKSGAQPVTVNFRYEYVDAGARSSSQSDVKISVPISQPDRFEISDPVVPDQVIAGQENTVTMEYVNKGKGDIANVEATMEGEGFDATMKTQYVGNVASGATGTIGYAFTPSAAGELKATLKVTYEDSDGQSKTKEFPLTVSVADVPAADQPGASDSVEGRGGDRGLPVPAYVAIAVGVVAVIAAIVLLVRRRRKQKAKKNDIDEDWDDWSEGKDDKTDTGVTDGAAADTAPIAPVSPASPAGPSHKA